jgi:hypothetical protein
VTQTLPDHQKHYYRQKTDSNTSIEYYKGYEIDNDSQRHAKESQGCIPYHRRCKVFVDQPMLVACIPPDEPQQYTRYQEECIEEQSCDYKINIQALPIPT